MAPEGQQKVQQKGTTGGAQHVQEMRHEARGHGEKKKRDRVTLDNAQKFSVQTRVLSSVYVASLPSFLLPPPLMSYAVGFTVHDGSKRREDWCKIGLS
jgi:hypothetical protein